MKSHLAARHRTGKLNCNPQYSWVRTGRAKVHGPGTISGLPYRELVPGPAPGIGNPKTASAVPLRWSLFFGKEKPGGVNLRPRSFGWCEPAEFVNSLTAEGTPLKHVV